MIRTESSFRPNHTCDPSKLCRFAQRLCIPVKQTSFETRVITGVLWTPIPTLFIAFETCKFVYLRHPPPVVIYTALLLRAHIQTYYIRSRNESQFYNWNNLHIFMLSYLYKAEGVPL